MKNYKIIKNKNWEGHNVQLWIGYQGFTIQTGKENQNFIYKMLKKAFKNLKLK